MIRRVLNYLLILLSNQKMTSIFNFIPYTKKSTDQSLIPYINPKQYGIYQMQPDTKLTSLEVLLNSFDTQNQIQRLTLFLSGYLLQHIQISSIAQINRLNISINILNNGVRENLITTLQRKSLLKQLIDKKYKTTEEFEMMLNNLFEEAVNKNLMGVQEGPKNQDTQSQKYIQQLMRREKEQQERLKKAQNQSILLMKQLQLRDQQSYKNKLNEASKVQIKMNCTICLDQIKLADLALLNCEHSYHKQCLIGHFTQNMKDRKFPLKCPDCEEVCIPSDVTEYLSQDDMRLYQKLSFQTYVNAHNQDMSWCPTAGCQYVFCFDEDQSQFSCPLCHLTYCLKCKVPFHNGQSCKQFNINRVFDKNDQKFIQFVKGAKYKQCPSCKFWVSKNQGCDHMTCRCKYQFCYVCGGKYQACDCMKNPPPMQIGIRHPERLVRQHVPLRRPRQSQQSQQRNPRPMFNLNNVVLKFD